MGQPRAAAAAVGAAATALRRRLVAAADGGAGVQPRRRRARRKSAAAAATRRRTSSVATAPAADRASDDVRAAATRAPQRAGLDPAPRARARGRRRRLTRCRAGAPPPPPPAGRRGGAGVGGDRDPPPLPPTRSDAGRQGAVGDPTGARVAPRCASPRAATAAREGWLSQPPAAPIAGGWEPAAIVRCTALHLQSPRRAPQTRMISSHPSAYSSSSAMIAHNFDEIRLLASDRLFTGRMNICTLDKGRPHCWPVTMLESKPSCDGSLPAAVGELVRWHQPQRRHLIVT